MKYFVIHYPKKPGRKTLLIRQFEKYGIDLGDVTWIEGLNKDDYFVEWLKVKTKSPKPLGHMSCGIKHYMAMTLMVENDISEAIIFEDDVIIHPEFTKLDYNTFPREVGFLRLGAGVHIIEPSFKVGPNATETYSIQNGGGSEAQWLTKEFAKSFIEHANFDYTVDSAHQGFLMMCNKPLLMRYVCHQTSLGNESDSSTGGQCPGIWHEYVQNFSKYKAYNFQSLVNEFKNTMTIMYPTKGAGLANVLIHLCDFFANNPDGVVHESICDYEMGHWLNFKFPVTSQVCTRTYTPRIAINQFTITQVHPMVRKLIEPSAELEKLIDSYSHLVKGVKCGIHIRRGSCASDSRKTVENDGDVYADESALKIFKRISEEGDVFLASDSPETKKLFPRARTLDTTIAVVHGHCPDLPTKDRRNIFVDFFLLAKCPKLYVTGGNFPQMPGLSTFGYMAAFYGNVPFEIISNSS